MSSRCVSGGIVWGAIPAEPRVGPLWRVGNIAGWLGPSSPSAGGGGGLLTEGGDTLVTEAGDRLVTE